MSVFDAVEYVLTFGLASRTLAPIDAIGVDEISTAMVTGTWPLFTRSIPA